MTTQENDQLLIDTTRQPTKGIRIVCLSDTHNTSKTLNVPDGDILIIAGDVFNKGYEHEIQKFDAYLATLPHKHKIMIAGNHDWALAYATPEEIKTLITNAVYLQDSGIELEGIKFWGSPWQPEFCDWAFNLPRGKLLAEVWSLIPDDIDVLITHGPPYGILDQNDIGQHVGCLDLLEALDRVQPKLHIFGHIHESAGKLEKDGITFVNACICDGKYRPVNPPIVVDFQT